MAHNEAWREPIFLAPAMPERQPDDWDDDMGDDE